MDVLYLYRALTSVLLGLMSALGIQPAPATWQMQPLDGRSVSLTISDHPHSSQSAAIRIDEFDGLDALLNDHHGSSAQPVHFRLKRDAGRFEFDGVMRRGAGGGTMEFAPSDTFSAALATRGFDRPNRIEQMKMAWHDTGVAFIDELAAGNTSILRCSNWSTLATTASIGPTCVSCPRWDTSVARSTR